MAEFLPWSEAKSVEYALAGRGQELIAAYKAGFRVDPDIIHYLLQNGVSPACDYFYGLGFKLRHEIFDTAMRKRLYDVVVWYHNHCGSSNACIVLVYCYDINGIPGLEALYALGIRLREKDYITVSELKDRDLPFLEWMYKKGCDPCALSDDIYNHCLYIARNSPAIYQFLRSKKAVAKIA